MEDILVEYLKTNPWPEKTIPAPNLALPDAKIRQYAKIRQCRDCGGSFKAHFKPQLYRDDCIHRRRLTDVATLWANRTRERMYRLERLGLTGA